MMKTTLSVAGLIAAVSAFTQPTSQTYGALLTPNTQSSVTTGQDYSITWDPSKYATDGVTVSLVLCNGPGSNCVLQSSAIVEKVPAAAASYTWNVPCSLPAGEANTATGYGMLIIVDGVGVFQYSTQFSVVAGASCPSSSHSSTTTSSGSSGPSSPSSPSRSPSGSPSGPSGPSVTSSGWYGWTSTFNTTTTPTWTAASGYTTASTVATTGAAYTPSGSSPAAASASASPSKFTGAAALPTAFANAAGIIGAAGLAMLAL